MIVPSGRPVNAATRRAGQLVGLTTLLIAFALAPVSAGVPALAQSASPTASAPLEIAVIATGSSCDLRPPVDSVPAGLVALTLHNDAADPYQVQVAELGDADSPSEIKIDALGRMAPDPSVRALVGGPGAIITGGTMRVILELGGDIERGVRHYALLCSVPGKQKEAFVRLLDAVPPQSNASPALESGENLVVRQSDDGADLPGVVAPGQRVWRVTNGGTTAHSLVLLRFPIGTRPEEIRLALSELSTDGVLPPDGTYAGGMRALSPGKQAWLALDSDLPPGTYAAVCDIHGEMKIFVVQ